MTETALPLGRIRPAIAEWNREDRALPVLPLAACAGLDALAAGMLLLGSPPAPLLGVAAGLALHGAVVLLLSRAIPAGTRPGARWLCVSAVLAVPGVGAAVAIAALVTRGRGSAFRRRRRPAGRRPTYSRAALERLAGALSPCDALLGGDAERQRDALTGLARRSDPEAIALLRRATAGPDADLAVRAALVLDEIAERAELRACARHSAEARHGTG